MACPTRLFWPETGPKPVRLWPVAPSPQVIAPAAASPPLCQSGLATAKSPPGSAVTPPGTRKVEEPPTRSPGVAPTRLFAAPTTPTVPAAPLPQVTAPVPLIGPPFQNGLSTT